MLETTDIQTKLKWITYIVFARITLTKCIRGPNYHFDWF